MNLIEYLATIEDANTVIYLGCDSGWFYIGKYWTVCRDYNEICKFLYKEAKKTDKARRKNYQTAKYFLYKGCKEISLPAYIRMWKKLSELEKRWKHTQEFLKAYDKDNPKIKKVYKKALPEDSNSIAIKLYGYAPGKYWFKEEWEEKHGKI